MGGLRGRQIASLIVGRSARSHIAASFDHPDATESIYSISDLIDARATRLRLVRHGIHSLCPGKQVVVIDSGGYQFLRHGKFPLEADELIGFYNECGADVGVALDRPVFIGASPMMAKTIIRSNLGRYLSMLRQARNDLTIIPVLHGPTPGVAAWECRQLSAINEAPPIVGLGGVVPHFVEITRNFRFSRDIAAKLNMVRQLRERILMARESFPDSRLHVFGAGGTVSIALALSAGADSIDSSGWRVRAAFGCILGPWGRQLRIRSRTCSPAAFAQNLREATSGCRCPVCLQPSGRKSLPRLLRSFESRATHNLWMQFSDLARVKATLLGRHPAPHLLAPMLASHPLHSILDMVRAQRG